VAGGRPLAHEAECFAIYTRQADEAEELFAAVNMEVSAFREAHASQDLPKGVVIAIGAADALDRDIEAMRQEGRPRDRALEWTIPDRGLTVWTASGRPYTMEQGPYFREAFEIPVERAREAGLIPVEVTGISWVCILPTERYFNVSFDEVVQTRRMKMEQVVANLPAQVRAANAAALPIMRAGAEVAYVKMRYLDVKLMRLQRRETLELALLRQAFTEDELDAELEKLEREIDEEWRGIWRRKPVD
jgi:hypothetical protein